jgi:membrane-associated phospholipid phosphatase
VSFSESSGIRLLCHVIFRNSSWQISDGPLEKISAANYSKFDNAMPSLKKNRVLPPSLLVSFSAMSVFGLLMICVKPSADSGQLLPRHNLLTNLDQEVNETLHHVNQESPASVQVFTHITDFGGGVWIRELATLVALGLVIVPCYQVIFHGKGINLPLWGLALSLIWIVVLLLGEFLNLELKDYVMRGRPPYHEAAHAAGYSFPSGHSMAAFIAYGMLAYLLRLAIPRGRIQIVMFVLLGSIVLLVGFSRIYLGAHWFSDVIGGFAAGAVWLGFCIGLIESARVIIRAAASAKIAERSLANFLPEQPIPSPEIAISEKTV